MPTVFAHALCAALALAQAPPAPPAPAVTDALRAPRPAGGEYFGMYILGKKVGYTFINLTYAPGSRDKVKYVEDSVVRATVGSREVERIMKESEVFEAKPGGRLLSFTIEQRGDGGDQVLDGTPT